MTLSVRKQQLISANRWMTLMAMAQHRIDLPAPDLASPAVSVEHLDVRFGSGQAEFTALMRTLA